MSEPKDEKMRDAEYRIKIRNCVPLINSSGSQEGVKETQDLLAWYEKELWDRHLAEGVREKTTKDTLLKRLRALNVDRVRYFGHTLEEWSSLEWAAAACGEAGEVANAVKKVRRKDDGCEINTGGKTREELVAAIAEEIADTIIYLDLLAAREGIDLESVLIDKFDKVSDRVGYPRKLK